MRFFTSYYEKKLFYAIAKKLINEPIIDDYEAIGYTCDYIGDKKYFVFQCRKCKAIKKVTATTVKLKNKTNTFKHLDGTIKCKIRSNNKVQLEIKKLKDIF